MLQEIWGNNYKINFLDSDNQEAKVEGKYYPKFVDIVISDNNMPIFCLGVKFITSNYKQNSINYFENMMGETANIQASNIPYAHIIILRYKTPYYTKFDSVNPSRIETISAYDIKKYLNLIFDNPQAHRPFEISTFFVNIDEKNYKVQKADLSESIESSICKLIENKLSPENLFKQIENYKLHYETNHHK